jgi:hypothetical protein
VVRGRNASEQKAPLHWSDVERALADLSDEPRDLRAKALIAIAYSTMARRADHYRRRGRSDLQADRLATPSRSGPPPLSH